MAISSFRWLWVVGVNTKLSISALFKTGLILDGATEVVTKTGLVLSIGVDTDEVWERVVKLVSSLPGLILEQSVMKVLSVSLVLDLALGSMFDNITLWSVKVLLLSKDWINVFLLS